MVQCGQCAPQPPALKQQPAIPGPCRPLAFSHGATDELTHSLGQTRVHLGMNMAATAVPLDPEDPRGPEDAVLYFGIIDILQVRTTVSVLQEVCRPTCCWHLLPDTWRCKQVLMVSNSINSSWRSAAPPAAAGCCFQSIRQPHIPSVAAMTSHTATSYQGEGDVSTCGKSISLAP